MLQGIFCWILSSVFFFNPQPESITNTLNELSVIFVFLNLSMLHQDRIYELIVMFNKNLKCWCTCTKKYNGIN